MYGQGNYGSQFVHGPNAPTPPAYPQRPLAQTPPPPPPHFQPGSSAPPPLLNQQAPPAVPHHIGHPGPHIYHQHGPSAPPPTINQGPNRVPPGGRANTGQPYLQIHGSTPLPHTYTNNQQNSQQPSHLGAQNVRQFPPPVPPPPLGPPRSELLQSPPPPRVLPPPPPPPPPLQEQTLYRTPAHPRPQPSGAVNGLQLLPSLPLPPPTRSFSSPAQVGSFVNSTVGQSHPSSMVPPPPPSSPPPVPPSPPLPSSVGHNAPHVGHLNRESGSGSEVGPLPVDGISDAGAILYLPPPPPKPMEQRVVQKIEDLCQLIAKNGQDIEDMTYQTEIKNPEFAFLNGGEPGSEAAIAHEYFLWMKRKCVLAYNTDERQSVSTSAPSRNESSVQSDLQTIGVGCNSASDSDMEMEDDFTQSDEDQGVSYSIERLNDGFNLVTEKLDMKEHSNELHNLSKGGPMRVVLSEKVQNSESSKQGEQGLLHDHSSTSELRSPVMIFTGASEWPVTRNLEIATGPLSSELGTSRTSTAAEAINSDVCSGELTKGGSPFRLIQDHYASDDSSENDNEPHHQDDSPLKLSPQVTAGPNNSQKDAGCNLETEVESKGSCRTGNGFGLLSESSMPNKAQKVSPDSQKETKDTGTASISSGTTDEHVDYNHEIPVPYSHSAPHEALWYKDDVDSAGVDVSKDAGFQKKNNEKKEKLESTPSKVDEFGRLVREEATDSDSDDSHYTQRRDKRVRSRSRSRSPLDRRRRRRSPWKRRERRSRSRSWSPRNRRSRSRSPPYRRTSQFSAGNRRRDKGQLPECFDFLRGRCYRGASCRYMHHESDRSSGSRNQKNKQQYLEVPPRLKTSKFSEEIHGISVKVSNHEREAFKSHEMQISQDVASATKDVNTNRKREDTLRDTRQSGISDSGGQIFNSDMINYESARGVIKVQEVPAAQGKAELPAIAIPHGESYQGTVDSHQPLSADSFPSKSVSDADALKSQGLQSAGYSARLINNSLISDLLGNNLSTSNESLQIMTQSCPDRSSVGQLLSSELFASQQSSAPKNSSHTISAMGFSHHPSELHPPVSQGDNAAHLPPPPKDHNLTPQSISFPFGSASGESFHPYGSPLPNQHSQYSVAPSTSWTSLPPPPRPPHDSSSHAGTAISSVSSQFQESHLPSFSSQTSVHYPSNRPIYTQVGEFPSRAYPPGQEAHRPVSYVEELGSQPLPTSNQPSQPFGRTSLVRENHLSQLPVQDSISSSLSAPGNICSQPIPSSLELSTNKMKPFSGDNLTPGEPMRSSSQGHSYSQQQQPPHGFQYPATDSILGVPGKTGSGSRYPPDLLDGHQSSQLPDFGGSRISAHYNPYASTFELPLRSKFGSDDHSFKLSHVPVDGLGVGGVGSRQTTSSPSSTKAVGQILPRAGGDQYDPLFDSIEPSSNSVGRDDQGQKQEHIGESDTIISLSGTRKPPLDVEEEHKEIGAVASTTSLNNDEYGETADAEVGAVENESPSNPMNTANMSGGEIEIDQIKSSGKSRKSKKDSRSMKHFKIAVADFVKEVLKPSWRQGNMSKEAFKTIVKKTVDKVSGAMKSHQIPKSQAKIDQYIDSSQRKLTKLVMGYVDKYVKV